MKVGGVNSLAHCYIGGLYSTHILKGLLDRTSTNTTSISSGLGRILLGIILTANKTPGHHNKNAINFKIRWKDFIIKNMF